MLKISRFFMDYEEEQIGITHMPQFGWCLESDRNNVVQSSYELQIAKDFDFADIIYKSGEQNSCQSAQIKIDGTKLESMRKYYVRVRVEAQGEWSDWNEHFFVTGILNPSEWQAEFITAEEEKDAENSKGTYVRTSFLIQAPVKEAYVCTTALGLYQFYVNGKKVGMDELTPGWTSYHRHLCVQTYEITKYIQYGENGMGAMLAAGWYKGKMGFEGLKKRRNHYGKNSAFLAQVLVRYQDGREEIFTTDESWMGADSPVVFAEIYDGETYDAGKEIEGWSQAGKPEAEWKSVRVVPFDFKALSGQGSGKVRRIDRLSPKRIFETPKGDTVLDFGQNMTGIIEVKTRGKAGDVIELQCFEVLDTEGNVYFDNLRDAKQTIRYIFAEDGECIYTPSFTFMGFQYVKIVSFPQKPELEQFTAYTLHSDMKQTGVFTYSNLDLNQLAHNILWGLKGNFVDVPTDCPQRDERLGWTGDSQIFCRTACFFMNTYNFYRKWLKDVEADQTKEGGVAHVVPDILTGNIENNWLLGQGTHSAAAWADAAVINPWNLYLSFGDTEILREQYDSMKRWIDFMEVHSRDYLWEYQLQFGDWVALDAEEGSYFGATPNSLICTAYFAYSTELFSKIAKILGKEKDYVNYRRLYENVKEKFQRTFFDEKGNMTAMTQTAHILALHFHLVPEEYRKKTVQGLLKLLEQENGHLVTGFVGTPYFCHALSENGQVEKAYELLLKDDFPSWLYQVKMGATTIWEHWDGKKPDGTMWSPDMNSFNHYAYGAIGEWMVRAMIGLEVDEQHPGYSHFLLYPRLGGNLTWVSGTYESIYGQIKSSWKIEGYKVTWNVEVPVNTTATLYLEHVSEIRSSDGLEFQKDGELFRAETGSGFYEIIYVRNK